MISMSQTYSIRQLRKSGESISEIARKVGVSRNTVYAKLAAPDLSPQMPVKEPREKMLDAYRPVIEGYLDEDERGWRKQRHTARRIWQRLRDEHGVACSESTVRHYVHDLKVQRRGVAESYLDLVWSPGEAQADFGEADFAVVGARRRMSFFVLSFPFSNMGFAQVFPSENAECVCQALKQIFEYVGGVPTRIVFDNAAGVGRRVCDEVRTTETFAAFAAHYGFAFSFCNPYSGHEKGNVEKKVGYIRDNLFVPLPQIASADAFNARLLDRSMALSDKAHWIKGENELQLFVEDRFAMMGLPPAPFSVVRYEVRKADRLGKVRVGGPHLYSADPSLAGRELVCGIGATTVTIATRDGAVVAEHRRAYGDAPTDTADPASQLALLCQRPGAWANSKVRSAIPDDLRGHMDSLGKSDLKAELRLMRDQAAASGWDATVQAMAGALLATGRIDRASVAVGAARIAGGAVEYDEPVDLSAYDEAFSPAGR